MQTKTTTSQSKSLGTTATSVQRSESKGSKLAWVPRLCKDVAKLPTDKREPGGEWLGVPAGRLQALLTSSDNPASRTVSEAYYQFSEQKELTHT